MKLYNEQLEIFKKGCFEKIDNQFMMEGVEVLQEVKSVQEKYDKLDTDTFINELRDSITGHALGYELINIDKHGFDCKKIGKDGKENFLEVKSASFSSKSWQATFNDTTIEKAKAFQDEKLFLALSVWKGASELLFICYGQSKELGEYLEEKVNHFKAGNTVRSTQSIGLSKLIFDYNFKIIPYNKTIKEVKDILVLKSGSFKKISDDNFIELKDAI